MHQINDAALYILRTNIKKFKRQYSNLIARDVNKDITLEITFNPIWTLLCNKYNKNLKTWEKLENNKVTRKIKNSKKIKKQINPQNSSRGRGEERLAKVTYTCRRVKTMRRQRGQGGRGPPQDTNNNDRWRRILSAPNEKERSRSFCLQG